MKYSLLITETGERDVNVAVETVDHIFLNPAAADSLLEAFEDRIASITSLPSKYALASDPVLRSWGIRVVTVKDYLLFYRISEMNQTVAVLRFMHARRNWLALLHQGLP